MNIGDWITKWSLLRPGKKALVFEDRSFTYLEFNRRTNQFAQLLLDRGVKKGDRVAVLLYNRHQYLEILFGLSKIGAIMVPLNWRLAGPELQFLIADSGSRMLVFESELKEVIVSIRPQLDIVEEGYVSLGEEGPNWALNFEKVLLACSVEEPSIPWPVGDEDPHIIMYTSGTTGVPKGSVLPHRKTFFNVLNADLFYDLIAADVMLITRPLFHSGGLLVDALPVMYKGGTLILRRRFRSPEVFETIQTYRVTVVEMAGTLFQFLLQECDPRHYDLSSVRCYFTGGERIPTAMLKEYHRKGIIISQVFGLTETSTITWLPYGDAVRKMGSVGLPIFHGEVRIVDKMDREVPPGEVGEIVVKGPPVMSGYWNRPDLTNETIREGWFHTGDLAREDEEGYLYIVDREKDVYISGGENVYPAEIEKVLFTHPKVFDVGIVGVPDKKWGEVGKAFIVLKAGERMKPEEAFLFLQGKVAKYKMPKYIEFINELPKTPSGKIQKYQLKQRHLQLPKPEKEVILS